MIELLDRNLPLLEKIRSGDRKAFEEVYKDFYEELCRFSMFILHDHQLAEEVVDDVMFYLWDNHERLEIASLHSWLLKAVRNSSINVLNSKAHRERRSMGSLAGSDRYDILSSLFDDSHPLEQILVLELEKQVHDAIESLPTETKRVFMLCRLEGKKYAEAAKSLGISVNTVKYHLKNATRLLGEILSKYLLFLLVIRNIFR